MILSIPIYQVDAFTTKTFGGNPAAICVVEQQIPDQILQKIAAENNLAETAFIWKNSGHYKIRWFTPEIEVDLCGHATLASAFVLFSLLHEIENPIRFESRSGILTVTKENDGRLVLDFPEDNIIDHIIPDHLSEGLNTKILRCVRGKSDYLVQVENEEVLQQLQPDLTQIKKINARGIIVTAKGSDVDFVSRCFFPQSGIDEDPVTGSAHTTLVPFWSAILDKKQFIARQISKRQGILYLESKGNRVLIGGYAAHYLTGTIFIEV